MAMPAITTRPGLILAHSDLTYCALVRHAFIRRGWDVYVAQDGPEARYLAQSLQPEAVVLEAELVNESGWLTCDKLTRELHDLDVFLIAEDTPSERRLAAFVGASALIRRQDGVLRLVEEVVARNLPVAG